MVEGNVMLHQYLREVLIHFILVIEVKLLDDMP